MNVLARVPHGILVGLVLLFLWQSGCKNDISGPGGNQSNVITNPSFEDDVKWSLTGWNLYDTLNDTVQHFSNDVPILGGNWSLNLKVETLNDRAWADWYVVGPLPKSVYRLSVWSKPLNGWDGGSAGFQLRTPGAIITRNTTPINTEGWLYYTVEDTIQLFEDDTLVVRLNAGTGSSRIDDAVLFDEVTLLRFD